LGVGVDRIGGDRVDVEGAELLEQIAVDHSPKQLIDPVYEQALTRLG
jgi:hypothetical protein